MSNPLKELRRFGQSPWMDMISREMLDSGSLKRMIDEDGVAGVTSNPTIFDKAISKSSDYDPLLREAVAEGLDDPKALFERLAIRDIRDAADVLRPVYESARGTDGYVSLEVSPTLANDTDGTVEEARRLFKAVDRKNVMIKIPATREGLPAIERAIAEGINVNVTLIFSLERYMAAANAYLAGLERLDAGGRPLSDVASVASFFVSRIDTAVDKLLPEGSPLRGKTAVANAKTAYHLFRQIFGSERFEVLRKKGARLQRPLWASTGTKDPKYSDVLYVSELIGADTVNTIPPATWDAFRDHGKLRESIVEDVAGARAHLEALKTAGIDFAAVTDELEAAGVKAFADSFASLLGHLAEKARTLRESPAPAAQDSPAPAEPSADPMRRIWDKDASLWKSEPEHRKVIDNSLGWLRMPEVMAERTEELESFADEARNAGFEHAVVLGMGGSSLAPEVLRRTFPAREGYPVLHVLDSTEPETVAAMEKAADPAKTLYIVASKSGTTTEPLRLFDYFFAKVKAAVGDAAGRHFTAITDPGSRLEALAKEKGFFRTFLNFPDIGGRFSALSYFGMVPAALMGVDVKALLARAKTMAEACAPGSADNPGLSLGLALGEHARQGRDKLTLLVSPEIESLGLWLEQLIAESTGKEGKGVVPVAGEPPREPGRYGEDRVFAHIRLEGSAGKDVEDAAKSLKEGGHPVLTLSLSDPLDLGAEFFRWEIATAVLGHALGINPFDQPDVQAAKNKTKALLAELKSSGALPQAESHASGDGLTLSFSRASFEEMGAATGGLSLDEALTRFLAESRPGDYAGILAYLASDGRHERALKELRVALPRAANLPVQAGYGPRYLHSTGQVHKGGPNTGLFLLLSREGGPDLEIPGAGLTFGQLVTAQALGDFQALDSAGRRAVYVRIQGETDAGLRRLAQALEAAARTGLKV
ncbi:MAG: bifunctional transaldolase/phosoglucose isomerase [Elusimicrobiota bacterium]